MADTGWANSAQSMWLLLPEPLREFPADLAAVVVLVAVTCLTILVPGINETPLRIIFGLPFVLFLPGYALIAALFPEEGTSPTEDGPSPTDEEAIESDEGDDSTHDADSQTDESDTGGVGGLSLTGAGTNRGIDGIERVALSFGLSIAVVPLLGLVLNFTPWGIRLVPILVSVAGFTIGMTGVAATRRRALPEEDRFHVPYRRWLEAGRSELFEPETRLDGVLNVLLVCSILLAVGSVAYAVAVPPQGETFTEFYMLTEDDDGELVAAGYPTNFTVGESQPVVLGVGNHEATAVDYTVVVQLQQVEQTNNETTILDRQELDRFQVPTIGNNETWQGEYDISPTQVGENLRLQFLLYKDGVPGAPTQENAYRDIHLWLNVTGG